LRSVLQDVNEQIRSHGLTEGVAKEQLPNVSDADIGKTLNQFYLYLFAKQYAPEKPLFGLRDLNQLLTLLSAHPENQTDLSKVLQRNSLKDEYDTQSWASMHTSILQKYKEILTKINSILS
jgi:hypothetical protein